MFDLDAKQLNLRQEQSSINTGSKYTKIVNAGEAETTGRLEVPQVLAHISAQKADLHTACVRQHNAKKDNPDGKY